MLKNLIFQDLDHNYYRIFNITLPKYKFRSIKNLFFSSTLFEQDLVQFSAGSKYTLPGRAPFIAWSYLLRESCLA